MAGNAKKIPVGVEDFKKLREGYLFVDKTWFIKDFLDDHTDVTLITRPRRFGKTLTLSMLKYFFSLENKEENRVLFAGLAIETAGDGYMKEQGIRPVVSLTLKGARGEGYHGIRENLQEIIRNLYGNFRYLLASEKLGEDDKQYFLRMLEKKAVAAELQTALLNLMGLLARHHGRKAVLLLDEYDAPIISAWEHGCYDEGIEFMRGFLGNVLKTNDYLDFAVLTGVTRISKESIFSGLNNLRVCSVLSERYSDVFGFTTAEAARLMKDFGVEDRMPELQKWYDGYLFGRTEIYNPWSVIQFIDNGCRFKPYWLNTSGNSILNVLLEQVDDRRQKELEGLLQGISVSTPLRENIIYADIHTERDTLFMMLLTAGYLKAVDVWQDEDYMEWVSLQIPNLEIKLAFRDEILKNIVPRQGVTVLRDLLTAMLTGQSEDFALHLEELLRDFVSFHDAAQPECFYHGLMLGISVMLEGKYRVESNRESGYGRFDIAFFPKKAENPGVILELKSARTEAEMETLAKEALRQIEDKAYVAELQRQGVKNVWKYGVAFCGKKIWLTAD